MPEDFDDANAKDVAKKLLDNGYTSKARLLKAQRGGLKDAGLKSAEIDAILYWQENGEKRFIWFVFMLIYSNRPSLTINLLARRQRARAARDSEYVFYYLVGFAQRNWCPKKDSAP